MRCATHSSDSGVRVVPLPMDRCHADDVGTVEALGGLLRVPPRDLVPADATVAAAVAPECNASGVAGDLVSGHAFLWKTLWTVRGHTERLTSTGAAV